MNKKELRLKYKELRQNLSENEIDAMSLQIANTILKLDIWNKTYFHVFLPIEEQKEVNTEFVLHVLQGKDKEVVVSKADFDTREMIHFLLTDNTRIKKNEYNIPEPLDGIEVPTHKIDVVFVPLLAYDKFLSKCKPETIKIGLSFFEPEEFISDIFENDVKLNFCVTPETIYKF